MTIILADYACHLLQLDGEGKGVTDESKQRLTDFNNALLNSEKMYYYRNEDGIEMFEMESLLTYRDIYLERLYAGTSLLMEGEAVTLAAMNSSDEGYQKLYDEYTKKLGMTNLWKTEALLMEQLGKAFVEEDHEISISILRYFDGDIDFDLSHYSPSLGEEETIKAETGLLWQSSQLADKWEIQGIERLQKAKEQLLQNYVGKGLEGAALLFLGTFAPELAIVTSLGIMAAEGSASSITGLESQVSSQVTKLGIKSGNLVAQNIINCGIAIENMKKSLTEENYQLKMGWFGTGGTYSLDSEIFEILGKENEGITISGLYKPETIRQINVWEEKGIAGWMGWETDEKGRCEVADDIMEIIKQEDNLSQSESTEYETLLTGGYEITKEEDMVKFGNRIGRIEEAYKDLKGKEEAISLHDKWKGLVEKTGQREERP